MLFFDGRLGLTVAAALLGGLAGLGVAAPRAGACECVDGWRVVRESVTSSGSSAASHERYWLPEGDLSAYAGHAHIWFTSTEPETVHYLTSSP